MFAFQIFRLSGETINGAMDKAKQLCNIQFQKFDIFDCATKLETEFHQRRNTFRFNSLHPNASNTALHFGNLGKLLQLKDKGGTDCLEEVYRKLYKNIIEVNKKAGKLDSKGHLPYVGEDWADFPGGYDRAFKRFACAELGLPTNFNFDN